MSSPSSSTPSSPISTTTTMFSESSRPTSAAGSDAGADLSDLSIKEETVNVSEEDKAKAADIKKEANAAFGSASVFNIYSLAFNIDRIAFVMD